MIKVGYASGLDGISSCNHTPCSYVTKQVSMQQRVSESQQVHKDGNREKY